MYTGLEKYSIPNETLSKAFATDVKGANFCFTILSYQNTENFVNSIENLEYLLNVLWLYVHIELQ